MQLIRITAFIIIYSFLPITVTTTTSTPLCCPGDNRLIERTCSTNAQIQLNCSKRYLVDSSEENFSIDDNNNLLIFDSLIGRDRYCVSQIQNQTIALICFDEEDEIDNLEFVIHAIFELISVFFILLTVGVYSQVTELLDLEGQCIINSICGLAISFFVLAINQLNSAFIDPQFCATIAFIVYFSMLYAFFWLNLLAFHIWRTVVKPHLTHSFNHWPLLYFSIGVGGPVLFTTILAVAHSSNFQGWKIHPGLGEVKCWFKTIEGEFMYFYGPIGILLIFNLVYYTWTVSVLWTQLKQTDPTRNKVIKFRFVLCFKLFIIMGITWFFEVISAAFQNYETLKRVWFLTDCINTLQGVIIFLLLVVFRKKVIRGLANRSFCGKRFPDQWKTLKDDECDELIEEINLSKTDNNLIL